MLTIIGREDASTVVVASRLKSLLQVSKIKRLNRRGFYVVIPVHTGGVVRGSTVYVPKDGIQSHAYLS